MVASLKEFYPYVYGFPCKLITDHNPLTSLKGINSLTGKANYYSTHVLQKKNCCALQENVVSKQLTQYMTRKQLINMLLTAKC